MKATHKPISIRSIASLSPLGHHVGMVWDNYLSPKHCFTEYPLEDSSVMAAQLSHESRSVVEALRKSDQHYKSLDNSVLFAIAAAREAVRLSGWETDAEFGINIGSSRGATELFEKHHKEFINTGRAATLASPTTTLGNISSWVAHDLRSSGPEISHSITCSTALHALLNGVAWLRAGMADKFIVGGSEAPLTPFTFAQMQAMKIYSKDRSEFPCRAMDAGKKFNSMILGEGAAVCCLETGLNENTIAVVEGIGYATELLRHPTSISAEADCFQKSMRMALQDSDISEVDAVVMHAPGTVAGDRAELAAVSNVFHQQLPLLTTNKWKTGHTFGASGMLGIELAILMMQHGHFIGVPFTGAASTSKKISKVLVNAVGFGGNAVSVLLSKP